MKSIRFLIPYFGELPIWMSAFLTSCARNPSVEWLILTDDTLPRDLPPNVQFEAFTLDQLNALASQRLGVKIHKSAYSQVDLKPAYGVIFADYFQNVDFWGHCDLDVIWGDIRSYISEEVLDSHQIIASRKGLTSGHFTLWRNDEETNHLFSGAPNYRQIFEDPTYRGVDEPGISEFLKTIPSLDIYWDQTLAVGWTVLNRHPNGWVWNDGKLLDRRGNEHFYLHFMKWKNTLKTIDFQFKDQPNSFRCMKQGIWSGKPPLLRRFLDHVPIDVLWLRFFGKIGQQLARFRKGKIRIGNLKIGYEKSP